MLESLEKDIIMREGWLLLLHKDKKHPFRRTIPADKYGNPFDGLDKLETGRDEQKKLERNSLQQQTQMQMQMQTQCSSPVPPTMHKTSPLSSSSLSCVKCSAQLRLSTKFCLQCGTKVVKPHSSSLLSSTPARRPVKQPFSPTQPSPSAATKPKSKNALLNWCQCQLEGFEGVNVANFTKSWTDGLAFAALVAHFSPDSLDFELTVR